MNRPGRASTNAVGVTQKTARAPVSKQPKTSGTSKLAVSKVRSGKGIRKNA